MDAKRILEQIALPPPPLRVDERGVIRVGRTRIPLETVLTAFRQGYTPEEIVMQFPVLQLEDVYATVTCYLHNREILDAYLEKVKRLGEKNREQLETLLPTRELRQRLRRRYEEIRAQQASDKTTE